MSDPKKEQILITNLTVNDDAFGVLPDSGEGVYIPPGVTRASRLVAGEYRIVMLIPNNPERQTNTKWMGIFVEPPEGHAISSEDQDPSYEQRLLDVFEDAEIGYLTTSEAAKELNLHVSAARDVLNKMFNERKLARADVHYGSDKRACNVLWAKTPEDFL